MKMKPQGWVSFFLGIVLAVLGVWGLVHTFSIGSVILLVIGIGLAFLGWRGGRTG
jgi:hypothetical protein